MTRRPTPDIRLVERMAAGDRDAHDEFSERHRLSLYAQVYATLVDAVAAERVVVEALERAWHAAKDFNPGFWSAVAVLVGSTIGGGIFRTPAVIAERVPAPLPMFSVWVLGGLLALCGALTYAELAALFPRSGGVYVYIREGFGRLPAFLFGWTELVLIRASALGAISTPFAEYLLRSIGRDPALPENAGLVHYVAAAAIAVTAALNYYGVRWSAFVLNLTTGAKYGALLWLVLLAFFVGHGDWTHFTTAAGPLTPGLFGLALVSVLWAYDGWGDLSFVGGEVRDPERNLPRALVMGSAAIIAIYLLVNAAYLYLLPLGQMARSPLVAADAAQAVLGRIGVGAVTGVVMLATFSTLVGSILTAPRIFFAMADDGLFFRAIAKVHPQYQTPSAALLFVLASFLILGNALWAHPRETGFAFLIILLGVPVYYRWIRGRRAERRPT